MEKEKIIIGNWKMNPQTEDKALNLARGIVNQLSDVQRHSVEIGVAPPFVFIEGVSGVIKQSNILLGAQDVFWAKGGPHTGEISVDELKSLGVEFVIVGHSERRKRGETERQVNRKVRAALEDGLKVILCVGEKKSQRKKGVDTARKFVCGELEKDLEGIYDLLDENPDNLMIAYEPLWAISTEEGSEPATPEKALEIITFIKRFLDINNIANSNETKVLYGGSVDSSNAKDFLGNEIIDGALVGSASLDAEEFLGIINSVK